MSFLRAFDGETERGDRGDGFRSRKGGEWRKALSRVSCGWNLGADRGRRVTAGNIVVIQRTALQITTWLIL